MALPIEQILNDVIEQFPAARLVIQAPPGAGKSTRLPLALLTHAKTGTIVMLQPRRLAAINIAHYLAQQLGESVGHTVGYAIRGEQKRSQHTRLIVITEGILVRWLQNDPELAGIDTVIFDEFHERNLASDLSLALLLDTLALREDLSLLIMSATLPAEPIQAWLQQALDASVSVLKSDGRQHPLAIHYRSPGQQNWLQHISVVVKEALSNAQQGVLIFVPGVREINQVIRQVSAAVDVPCLPLHGQLSLTEQRQALMPTLERRIIVATNVAETSLTIDGIDCVVDSGRERISLYRPQYATSQLVTRYISKASATQRAGRAGRQGPGQVYRLWAESDEHGFSDFADADVATQDLTQLVAEVGLWGAQVDNLNWLTLPSPTNTAHARQVLARLAIFSPSGQLTETGREVMQLGTDSRLARIAIKAMSQCVAQKAAVAVALATLEEPVKALVQDDLFDTLAEHLQQAATSSRWYQRLRHWSSVFEMTPQRVVRDNLSGAEALPELLLYGFQERLAKRIDNGTIQLISGVRLQVECVKSEWLLALNVVLAEDVNRHRGRLLLPINAAMLDQHEAVAVTETDRVDVASGRKAALFIDRHVGALQLSRQRSEHAPTQQQIHLGLAQWLSKHGFSALDWPTKALQLWHRLHYLLLEWEPAAEWFGTIQPTPESMLEGLEQWAFPYWTDINGLADLRRWNPLSALQQLLNYADYQQFSQLCPEAWQAPSGREVRIVYPSLSEARQGIKPRVTIKLQEAFGEPTSPTLMNGKHRLVMDLLSPGGRLLQRTEDLASFWKNAYPAVSKEMRGRYPKHPWPDDPVKAIATLKTNRQLR